MLAGNVILTEYVILNEVKNLRVLWDASASLSVAKLLLKVKSIILKCTRAWFLFFRTALRLSYYAWCLRFACGRFAKFSLDW